MLAGKFDRLIGRIFFRGHARANAASAELVRLAIGWGHRCQRRSREDLEVLRDAYKNLVEETTKASLPMPENKPRKGSSDPDNKLRFLDCAVVNNLHKIISEQSDGKLQPYDTVRALFSEGTPLYEDAGFNERNHTQIAVLTTSCRSVSPSTIS